MGRAVGSLTQVSWGVAAAIVAAFGGGVHAEINLEFRPESPTSFVGAEVRIGLYAISDNSKTQLTSSVQTIFAWDPLTLQLLGREQTGATPLLSSTFPNDPYGLNESNPPQDGDGIHVAFANFGNPIPATPEGTLLTTFIFEGLAPTKATPVDILEEAGDPSGRTTVFDDDQPNTDITGTLTGTFVELVKAPGPKMLLLTDEVAVEPNDTVQVELWMTRLAGQEAAGFQAYLFYDTDELTFVDAVYTKDPFGLHIIIGGDINPNPGEIDLAAGIDTNNRQQATSQDSLLAVITFTVKPNGGGCLVTGAGFRAHSPPTRLSDDQGMELKPLDLCDLALERACPADIAPDGGNSIVNVDDLLRVINGWGTCAPTPACCSSDIVPSGDTNVDDLLAVINAWGPCPK